MKSAPSSVIDVRRLEPRFRHAHIFSTFAALDVGSAIELVNDHDPRPLYAVPVPMARPVRVELPRGGPLGLARGHHQGAGFRRARKRRLLRWMRRRRAPLILPH